MQQPWPWGVIDLMVELKSTGLATEVLRLGPVPIGEVWELHHVAVEDVTSDYTSVRIGAATSLGQRPLEEKVTGLAGELYYSDSPTLVPPGQYVEPRFIGTTSGDLLRMYINGRAHMRS